VVGLENKDIKDKNVLWEYSDINSHQKMFSPQKRDMASRFEEKKFNKFFPKIFGSLIKHQREF